MMNLLWYEKPAEFWEEALPLGNGRLGGMIFSHPECERIQLNEDTLWSGRPSDEDGFSVQEDINEVRQLLQDKKYAAATTRTDRMTGAHDSQSYQMIGNLYLDFKSEGEVQNYRRQLDLNTATQTTVFTQGHTTFTREAFISANYQVLALRLSADAPDQLSFSLAMDSLMRHSCSVTENQCNLVGQCPFSNKARGERDTVWEADGKGGIKYVVKIRVLQIGGTCSASQDNTSVNVEQADEAVVFLAVRTGFKGWDEEPSDDIAAMASRCDELLDTAASIGWKQLKADHGEEYGVKYRRMSLDLGMHDPRPTDAILKKCCDPGDNPALVNLVFNYGRYLLLSSSRPGTQPANLQGIWNESLLPPWRSNYTTNINTEMNYWPAESCNLVDCAEPLLKFIRELAISGRRPARKLYNARGWCLHHNSDVWRYSYTGGSKAQHAMWPLGGVWMCRHLWEHYEFSKDTVFLKEALPIMKEAAAFVIDFMIEDADGNLTTAPSTSPENSFIDPETGERASVCVGSAMDLIMIRELFENVIQGSAILEERDALLTETEAALGKLATPKIGADGHLLEFGIEVEEPELHHRHISHLYGVFPGTLFTVDRNPQYFKAARKSLELRGDESTGWAMAWRVAMWARFRDGNRALKVLGNLLNYKDADPNSKTNKRGGGLYKNLFDAHPPFQIDGNFGATAAITELLLQSHRTQIKDDEASPIYILDLLPALPDAWRSGRAEGLRARGGIEVSLGWENGKVSELTVKATRKTKIIVQADERTMPVTLAAGESFQL